VRDLILFIWETALRRRTVQRLRCPEHWQPGATTLRIAEDIDKARFGREVELSKVAQALLNRHCDGPGLIWGAFDCRPSLRNAARDAGCFTEQEIRHLSLHDLRHGALTELASVSPNLPGIAHIAGHKRVSTTEGAARNSGHHSGHRREIGRFERPSHRANPPKSHH